MLRFAVRIALRGGGATPRRLSTNSIATIDTLPKNLVIDDMSVLKEDVSHRKRYIVCFIAYSPTDSFINLLNYLLAHLLVDSLIGT